MPEINMKEYMTDAQGRLVHVDQVKEIDKTRDGLRILSLRRLDISDPLWQKAMQSISDSLTVAGSKSYMRIYERVGNDNSWRNISLDFAAL